MCRSLIFLRLVVNSSCCVLTWSLHTELYNRQCLCDVFCDQRLGFSHCRETGGTEPAPSPSRMSTFVSSL